MSHILVAYSRGDSAFAHQLRQNLEQDGFTVWVDDRVDFGKDWWRDVSKAIEEAAALVVLMSPEAQSSRWIEREILYAESLEKPIFPVWIAGDIWPRLTDIQVIDARQGPMLDVTAQLTQAIRAFARVEPAHAYPTAAFPRQKTFARYVFGRCLLAAISLIVIAAIIIGLMVLTASPDDDAASEMVSSETQIAIQRTDTPEVVTEEAGDAPTSTSTQTSTPVSIHENTATPVALRPTPPRPSPTGLVMNTPTPVAMLPTQASVAQQVDATVAAIVLTEQSYLSPAEAAELAGLIVDNTDMRARTQTLLITLNIVFTVLAAAILIMTIFMSRGIGMRRSRRAHPAHPAHPEADKAPASFVGKHQVFISSSDRDRDWVDTLVNQLDREGFEVWWYAKDALGKPFGDEIVRAIFTAKVFVVIISPDSMGSKHVEEEIRIADRYDKPIINIVYRNTERRLYGLAKGSEINFTDEIEGDISYDEKQQAAMGFLLEAIDYHLGLQTAEKADAGMDSNDESAPAL